MKILQALIVCFLLQNVTLQAEKQLPPLPEYTLGKENAPILMIEYSSLSCSHCADFHTTVLPQIQKKYVETGQVKIEFRDFPSDRPSLQAHLLAYCAGDKYHELINYLFQNQDTWLLAKNPTAALKKIAIKKGINAKQFDSCMQNNTLIHQLISLRQQGENIYKIKATPTLIINGKIYPHALKFNELEKILEPLLSKTSLKKD